MIECLAITLLALMVQSEAGGESFPGKVAVAFVAMNRAEMSGQPIQDVLTRPKQFKINLRLPIDTDSWAAAQTAYQRRVSDPTYGADHFYAHAVKPRPEWYNEKYMTIRIGRHTFLKLGGF